LIAAVLSFSLSWVSPVQAANKTTLLTNAFQKFLTDGELNYSNSMAAAKNLYEPQIADSQSKISTAINQFKFVNQAVVLQAPPPSSTGLRNYMSVLKCPTNSDCTTPGTLTGGYTAGATTSVMDLLGGAQAFSSTSLAQMNIGLLQTVDLGISNGLFRLLNPD